ncbi:MAG: class I SAM-dependent methyltransferase [Burkholderiales bacterium]
MISTPYDQIAQEFGAARIRLQPKEVEYLAALLEPLSAPGTILDLGCGTGHPIATHLAGHGHRIVGVDGSSAMLALARERLPEHRWIHAYMEAVQFDEVFDAVVCWDSLFHVPRLQSATVIQNIHHWLKPAGRVMVSSGGIVDGQDGFTDTMFGHEFYYDSLPPEDVARLMEEIGFDLVVSEMCDQPDGGRNRGKWATIGARRA